MLLTSFINDFDEEMEGILVKFVEDRKMGVISKIFEDRNKVQINFSRLESWAENIYICFILIHITYIENNILKTI